MFKAQLHLPIVGIGHDAEVGTFGLRLVDAEKRGFEVELLREAMWLAMAVVDGATQLHGIIVVVGHIDPAIGLDSSSFWRRLIKPGLLRNMPHTRVPIVDMPECVLHVEVVVEREELRVGDDGDGVAVMIVVGVIGYADATWSRGIMHVLHFDRALIIAALWCLPDEEAVAVFSEHKFLIINGERNRIAFVQENQRL
jgi:hypothetical protein